jgi:uncharacterized protein YidB (DUF937 family)
VAARVALRLLAAARPPINKVVGSAILGSLLGGKPGSASATNVGGNPNAGLKDLIPGGLGQALGGATAGTALSGGLGALIKEFQQGGLGQAAQSWVGTGPNQKIASTDLERALGTDTLDALSKQTGVGRDDLLAGLSQHLPDLFCMPLRISISPMSCSCKPPAQ